MSSDSLNQDIDVFNLPVFSIADMFPLIQRDELEELAEDIKENGQQEPVVVAEINGVMTLVDGRNRLAACRIAGVVPTYRILDSDPTAYVLSANVHRRHLTKGQQAMATALAYPNSEQGKRETSLKIKEVGINAGYVSQARFVLRNCRDKAIEVLRNAKYPLTVAYEEAQAIVEKQRADEEDRQRNLAALAELRYEYPDIAALVDDQRLGLPEAIAAGNRRREEAAEKKRRAHEEAERQRLEAESKLAEAERAKKQAEREEAERREARRVSWFGQLMNLLSAESIMSSSAQIAIADEMKGLWPQFRSRYMIELKEARRRLHSIQSNLPALIEKVEAMNDEQA